jgi:chromosome segregation ATPase
MRIAAVVAVLFLSACVSKSEHEREIEELKQKLAERDVKLEALSGQVTVLKQQVSDLSRGIIQYLDALSALGKSSGALAAALDKKWDEAATLAEEAERSAKKTGAEFQSDVGEAAAALRKQGQKAVSGFAESLRKLAAVMEPKPPIREKQP